MRCIGVDIGLPYITFVEVFDSFPVFSVHDLIYLNLFQAQSHLATQRSTSNAPTGPEGAEGMVEDEEDGEDQETGEEIEVDDDDFTSTQR